MPLKRTNWSTEEVIALMQGHGKFVDMNGAPAPSVMNGDEAVDHLTNFFSDFLRNPEEPGALAYDTDRKEVVHIGARLPR